MNHTDGTINPILPGGIYAPEPYPASPDRDPDGSVIPGTAKRRKRKKKKKSNEEPPAQPGGSNEEPKESDGVPHVDIRATTFQNEMRERNESEITAVFLAQIALRRASALVNLAR